MKNNDLAFKLCKTCSYALQEVSGALTRDLAVMALGFVLVLYSAKTSAAAPWADETIGELQCEQILLTGMLIRKCPEKLVSLVIGSLSYILPPRCRDCLYWGLIVPDRMCQFVPNMT